MIGEHAKTQQSWLRRMLRASQGRRTKHRPRLGAMSTSLLNSLLTDHLDHGYAEAAARKADRAAAGEPVPARSRSAQLLLAVGLLLVGLLLATAYRHTTRQAPESERARQGLVRDVERGTATTDVLRRHAEALDGLLVKERDAVLAATETGDQVSRHVGELERAAAMVPVRGPGISVSFGDAVPAEQVDPATGERLTLPPDDTGRLRDRDLQSVVNALWAAGAEAIAINGERLAPITTIRAAGEAILVDLRPVSSPYTVDAIGDPDTLLPRFADSAAARRYQSQASVFGIRFTVNRAAELSLRSATGTDLRYAQPVELPASAGTPGGTPGGSAGTGTGTGSAPPPGGTGSTGPNPGGGP